MKKCKKAIMVFAAVFACILGLFPASRVLSASIKIKVPAKEIVLSKGEEEDFSLEIFKDGKLVDLDELDEDEIKITYSKDRICECYLGDETIYAKKKGECDITFEYKSVKATVHVIVKDASIVGDCFPVAVKSLIKCKGEDAKHSKMIYTVSDDTIAEIQEGKYIYGKKAGKVTLTASANGFSFSKEIKIIPELNLKLKSYKPDTDQYTVVIENNCDKAVEFIMSSLNRNSNMKVMTDQLSGTLTVKPGKESEITIYGAHAEEFFNSKGKLYDNSYMGFKVRYDGLSFCFEFNADGDVDKKSYHSFGDD